MEDILKNVSDIDFLSLFNNPQKICQLNFRAKIEEIRAETEQISLTVRSLDLKNTCYKGFYGIKGEIFPLLKVGDIVKINEIQIKLDDNFNLGLFIKLFRIEDMISVIKDEKENILDFSRDNIINTLKYLFNIEENLYSNIFVIEDDSFDDNYIIKCLENNTLYTLSKHSKFIKNALHKNDFIFILNYYEYKSTIELNLISHVENLTEEKLFMLLEKNENLKKKFFIGKIVEINTSEYNIILLNQEKKLFVKNKMKILIKSGKLGLGQLLIITNYIIASYENNISIIDETNKSFVYYSNQDLYFSNKLEINNLSVIQFHFLDFHDQQKDEIDNIYNAIKIKKKTIKIVSPKMNIIIETKRTRNYEYYPISLQLISKEKKNDYNNIKFKFNLLHGLLNKINAYINFKLKNPFFYEYIYYSLNEAFFKTIKIINIGRKEKCISICDNFGSSNRLRFNILNIPFQNECDSKLIENSNSLMVCEIFPKKSFVPKTVGIFSINDIKKNIKKLKSNNIFDSYYSDFGYIYNYFSENKIKDEDNFIKYCIDKYNDIILPNKQQDFLSISPYEEEISLSQLKTRIGIIVSYYLSKSNENNKNIFFGKISNIFSDINKHKNYLTYMQYLRLFKFLVKKILYNDEIYNICLISKLKENSPYLVAYRFNIDEINYINESSRLFMGYLQLDSYILTNHLLNNNKSYSLSIEPLFIIRKHLLQTYEGFFLIEKSSKGRYAQSITDERITVININKIFEFSNIINLNDIDQINEPQILKNHAFSISMELRHENNSHHKKNQKNIHITSPIYYFDKEQIKKIEYMKNKIIQGEDGRLIEAFIDEDRDVILSLQADIIYGELLDITLFIQEDFDILKEKMKKIRNMKNKFQDKPISLDENIKDNDNDNFNFDENNSDEKKNFENIYLRMKEIGTIMISDEEYTISLIKEIINTAKNNNTYNQLPEIIIYIDKRMKEEDSIKKKNN